MIWRGTWKCLVLLTLLAPASAWAADNCDAAARELDNIGEQISQLVAPCEMKEKNPCEGYNYHPVPDTGEDEHYGEKYNCVDTREEPCSKDQMAEIAQQIKALSERAEALRKGCFGGGE